MADDQDQDQADQKQPVGDWMQDGGFASRKMWMTILAFALVLGGAFLVVWRPGFGGSYDVYVGGIVAVLGAYLGANVGSRWATAKHVVAGLVKKVADEGKGDDEDEKKG